MVYLRTLNVLVEDLDLVFYIFILFPIYSHFVHSD